MKTRRLPLIALLVAVLVAGVATARAQSLVINTQPQSQTVTAGNSVTFSVTAGGTAPLAYQWYFPNGAGVFAYEFSVGGTTNASLTITNVLSSFAGDYYVTISDGVSTVASSNATLVVNPASTPIFALQPQDQTVVVGARVSMAAAADGALGFQWRKDGVNIPGETNQVRYQVGFGGTRVSPIVNVPAIASARLADAGVYTVIYTNATGSVTSRPVTLTVLNTNCLLGEPTGFADRFYNDGYVRRLPVFSTSDTSFFGYSDASQLTSYAGNPALAFHCTNLLGSEMTVITDVYRVMRGTVPAAPHAGSFTGPSLGLGYCSLVPVARTTNVFALTTPVIFPQPQSQTVNDGSDVTFSVTAGGSAPLAYQWFFNVTNALYGATNGSLTITNVDAYRAGIYFVTVSNALSSVTSSNAVLLVIPPPPQSQTVVIGETVTFVTDIGVDIPQWRKNGVDIPGATNLTLVPPLDPELGSSHYITTFAITNAQPTDAGLYTVVITNVSGSVTSSPAMLQVVSSLIQPPLPVPLSQIRTQGFSLNLAVEAGLTYRVQWSPVLPATNWLDLMTNLSSSAAAIQFLDSAATNQNRRFYRVISP